MRPEPNNDIDLLLRQLSRRNGSPVSEIEEQHLDADELNSYVANALPPAARARYTEHLADCLSCRKLVAQLSAAQGPAPAQSGATVVAPSGLMSFLANLFSPMVLRYAVPALGLILIAVVGVVVFRRDQAGSSVALVSDDQNTASKPYVATPAAPSVGDHNYALRDDNKAQTKVDASQRVAGDIAPPAEKGPGVESKPAGEATGAGAAEPPPPAAPKAAAADSETADAQKLKKEADTQQQAAAREAPKDRVDDANKTEPQGAVNSTVTVTAGNAARRDMTVRAAKSAEGNAARSEDNFKRAPAPATGAADERGRGEARGRDQARSQEEEKNLALVDKGETRSVAGRQFRKSGSVWIDSAYDSSKSVTTVARDSEQFRALIADEPSIREIADKLDGEILVVWKSRTYRIR